MEQEAISKNEIKNDSFVQIPTDDKTHLNLKQKKLSLSANTALCQQKLLMQDHAPTLLAEKLSKGNVHYLIPKLIPSRKAIQQHRNDRKPRFVPFEPYKCAVKPIIAPKKPNKAKKNKNNLDINVLVSQMSNMKTSELKAVTVSEALEEMTGFEKEKENFIKEIEKLKKERDYVQGQYKFQVQVNSELKNLLVAAVGEDMQTKVNVLTEDKLQLARALLDTANNLSTHTEQIEFLAGQCEVWRSKFLATSVMVEELARWKADLTHKNILLSKSSQRMLQLTAQIREMQIDLLKNLKFLAKLKQLNLPSGDVVSLTSECLNILQQMVLYSGIGMPENLIMTSLETLTEAEKDTIEALECVSQPLISTDEAFKAIVGQAFFTKTRDNIPQTQSLSTDNKHS